MSEILYRELAQQLNTIPSGFPATKSCVELKLLARLFTPDEATLACVMSMTPEPAADIAARAGADCATAGDILEVMARKGLIYVQQGKDQHLFGLEPHIGPEIPGLRLILKDPELAKLFEQYYQETRGISLANPPASYRVIPVQVSIPGDLQIHPHEQAVTLLENARSWAVRDCICRLQQHSINKDCGHPVGVCLFIAPVEGAFDNSEIDRVISKDEALRILQQAEDAGLIHTTWNWGNQPLNICNCCTCSCGILRGVVEFDIPTAIARSDFYSIVKTNICTGCASCIERCQFGALSMPQEVVVVDRAHCVGCGLCVTVCPTSALQLERRPEGENPIIPSNFTHWMTSFAENRGASLPDT